MEFSYVTDAMGATDFSFNVDAGVLALFMVAIMLSTVLYIGFKTMDASDSKRKSEQGK